jgi:hypothetical protein
VIDGVFVGGPRVGAPDHVQVERALGDRAAALADLVFGALDPDPFEVGVAKRIEDYSRMIVASVDRLCSSLLQAYYCHRRLTVRSQSERQVMDTDDSGKEWQ